MTAARRRHDPGRRDRIIDACLEVIVEHGVAGVSHRKVAQVADVPLGSMTYHFAGMDELLHEAFSRFAEANSARMAERLAAAGDTDAALDVVVDAITRVYPADHHDLVLTHELYTLAARDPAYRDITNAWMARSRAALEQYVDPTTARMLDALVEGLTIHRILDNEAQDDAVVATAVRRISGV